MNKSVAENVASRVRNFARKLSNLESNRKSLILRLFDLFTLALAISLSFFLAWPQAGVIEYLVASWLIPIVLLAAFHAFGVYFFRIRHFQPQALFLISTCLVLTAIFVGLVGYILSSDPDFLGFVFLAANFSIAAIAANRLLIAWTMSLTQNPVAAIENVFIYGAGRTAHSIVSIFRSVGIFNPIGFIDDDESLSGKFMDGLPIYRSDQVDELMKRYKPQRIFISQSTLTPSQKRKFVEKFLPYPVRLSTVPSIEDFLRGNISINLDKTFSIDELIARPRVKPQPELFLAKENLKSVFVVGAAGSIGSELCARLLRSGIHKLTVFDNSEYALYELKQRLQKVQSKLPTEIQINYVLGDMVNTQILSQAMKQSAPDVVYHVAAYKHVSMVEDNITSATYNNIAGTRNIIKAAKELRSLKRFVLVSSDKAVRPSSVMGATKRICEKMVLAAAREDRARSYSIVRFGNAIGSSGSVVPLFISQIKAGSDITVTDPQATRYFMTMREAAELIIQAGSLSDGTDNLFVLDMGEPIKILELARLLIRLHGMRETIPGKFKGDIAINIGGLKPGEKQIEELQITGKTLKTKHEKIFKLAERTELSKTQNQAIDQLLERALDGNEQDCIKIISGLVESYVPSENKTELQLSSAETQ